MMGPIEIPEHTKLETERLEQPTISKWQFKSTKSLKTSSKNLWRMLDSSRAVTQRFHNHFKYTIQAQLQTITARTCIIYLPHSVQKLSYILVVIRSHGMLKNTRQQNNVIAATTLYGQIPNHAASFSWAIFLEPNGLANLLCKKNEKWLWDWYTRCKVMGLFAKPQPCPHVITSIAWRKTNCRQTLNSIHTIIKIKNR